MRRAALLACGLLVLGGCQTMSEISDGKKVDYKSATTSPSLEVPPDLTTPSRDNRYALPEGRTSATLSGYQAERQQGRPGNTAVLPQVEGVRFERAGTQRWIVVARQPPEKLWTSVKEFWQENGLLISSESPEAGVMETDWAENRINLPQGLARDWLGKLVNSISSTGERDKFRTRLDRTADGQGTEIYISHRGLEEVYTTNETRERTVWQPRPNDPDLEAEFLRRLMVRLGVQEEKAKVAIVAPSQQRAELRTGPNGAEQLEVFEPFDRAWRRVGLALDRVGFTVEDRDRQKGLYFVRYADTDAEREKPGLFSKLFSTANDPKKAEQYRVQVTQGQEKSQVQVLNKDGTVEQSPTAQRILTLLHEQLK